MKILVSTSQSFNSKKILTGFLQKKSFFLTSFSRQKGMKNKEKLKYILITEAFFHLLKENCSGNILFSPENWLKRPQKISFTLSNIFFSFLRQRAPILAGLWRQKLGINGMLAHLS